MTSRTLVIEGMSCGHCASWVTESLLKVEGVADAQASLSDHNVVVKFDEKQVDDQSLKNAVESAGYQVATIS